MAVELRLEKQEIIEEVEALRILIQETDSNVLAFALYRNVAERETAMEALKERCTLPIFEFFLSAKHNNPIAFFQNISNNQRACIFYFDAEDALPDLTGYVNLQRETFANVPHAVIFWVREYGLKELATNAPDFWSWRSGVFDFRLEPFKMLPEFIQAELGVPLIYNYRVDLERKISLYQRLLQEYVEHDKPNKRFIAGLQMKLGRALYYLGEIDQAKNYSREALQLSRDLGEKHSIARSFHQLGMIHQAQGDYDSAMAKYEDSLRLKQELRDKRGIAITLHQLGMIHQAQEDYDSAVAKYEDSLRIARELGDKRGIAITLHQLGNIHYQQGDYESAVAKYEDSLRIARKVGDKSGIAATIHQLGMIHQAQGDYDSAVVKYEESLRLFEELGAKRERAAVLHQLGTIHQHQGDYESAVDKYEESLRLFEELGDKLNISNSKAQLGVLHEKLGNLQEARKNFEFALQQFTELKSPMSNQAKEDLERVKAKLKN